MIFSLAEDFAAALDTMPQDHPKRRLLRLLDEAIRRDIHFIDRHPTTLFQRMWNTCWWYDCPEKAAGDLRERQPKTQPPGQRGPSLHSVLEAWREAKTDRLPGFIWLRSVRPPLVSLGSPLRFVLTQADQKTACIALSPDGRLIATVDYSGAVRVWDVVSCRRRWEAQSASRPVRLIFSRNGDRLGVQESHGGVSSYYATDGAPLEDPVTRGALPPEGELEPPPLVLPAPLDYENHPKAFTAYFARDRLTILAARRGDWRPPAPDESRYTCSAISTCGRWLSRSLYRSWGSISTSATYLWHLGEKVGLKRRIAHRIDHQGAVVTCVAVSDECRRIAGGFEDGTVSVWSVREDGSPARLDATVEAGSEPLVDLALSADGDSLATLTADGSVRVWDVPAALVPPPRPTSGGEVPGATAIEVCPSGNWFMVEQHVPGSGSEHFSMWDARSLKQTSSIPGNTRPQVWHNKPISRRLFVDSGESIVFILSESYDPIVYKWSHGQERASMYERSSAMMFLDRLDEYGDRMIGEPDRPVVTEWKSVVAQQGVWRLGDTTVAVFATPLKHTTRLVRHPSDPLWVGTDGNRLFAVALEGDEPQTHSRASGSKEEQ